MLDWHSCQLCHLLQIKLFFLLLFIIIIFIIVNDNVRHRIAYVGVR